MFEWAVRYPSFMDAAVPIVATPRPTAYDKLIFDTWRRSAEELSGPRTEPDSAWMASRLATPFAWTTRFVNDWDAHAARHPRHGEGLQGVVVVARGLRGTAARDRVARHLGEVLATCPAPRRLRARLLIVWSPDDKLVDPRPAEAFSRLVGAETLVVPSACGHAGALVRAGADRARYASSSTGRRVSQPVNA